MFQRNLAGKLLPRIMRALHFPFDLGDVRGLAQQPGCSGGAEVEGERSVWTDGDPGGDRDALLAEGSQSITCCQLVLGDVGVQLLCVRS